MIADWTYTDVPEHVDLNHPLMPQRDDTDHAVYGVDPAWLHEVLLVWEAASGSLSGVTKSKMPDGPSANWMNSGIYSAARNIKIQSAGHFHKSMPSSAFSIYSFPDGIVFGDVPVDVSVGDPVRKSDISDMFKWMKDVKCIARNLTSAVSFTPQVVESDTEGEGTLPPSVECPVAYDWEWFYSSGEHQDTFGFYRRTSSSFNVSVSLPGLRSAWFNSASLFLMASAYAEPEPLSGDTSLYVPIGGTMSQVGDNLIVSASTSGVAIRNAFGIAEKGYKEGMQHDDDRVFGRYRCSVSVAASGTLYGIACFLNLASDYRHPSI